MDTDRNLLFGVLALQADLIAAQQFVEICSLWTTRKNVPLAELLIERGWILPADREHVDYLLERKLHKHDGDLRASLATVGDDIKRSLAAVDDPDIRRSLAEPAKRRISDPAATIDHVAEPSQRYRRTFLHASGGIGRVWLAHDSDLGRDVALKEIHPEQADDPTLRARFLQEARITGQLEHPGVVPVYELNWGAKNQQPFYTMRFVKGRTLSEAALAYHAKRSAGQAEALDLLKLLNAFVAVCNTVAYAHSRGVIHRDLKGQNVIVGDFGEVVVLDWGLAKLVGRPEGEAPAAAVVLDDVGADSGHTVQGQALGTPAYMAPEQSAGRLDRIDRRTDVYGLGAILYEILTGGPPFTGKSTGEVLRKVREEEPMSPRQLWPEVPPALEALCLRALAKRTEDRPASAAELAQEVQGWQESERRKAEEALRRQTEILQSILNSMSDGVVVVDETGKVLLDNPASDRIRGAPMEDLPPERWSERFGCYLSNSVTPFPSEQLPLARAMRGEEVNDAELIIRHDKRPEGIVLSVNSRPLRDKQGVLRGGLSVFRDVTARKKVEAELRKSRERFELAVQGSQDGLWDWDLTTDEVYYSPRYKAMLGYEDHEFPNRRQEWEERVHPDDVERVRSELRAHFKSRESLSWVEFRFRHKDGSYRWIRSRAFVLRDPTGRVYRMAGSHEDITDRKNAEEELAHERYLLHTLMDNMPDAIFFFDTANRAIRVNKTLAELVGLEDPAQIVGKTLFDFVSEDVARMVTDENVEIIRTGQPLVAKERWVLTSGGRMIWFSSTKMPLRDREGTIIGTFGIARDNTPRKKEEIALRDSEERYRSAIAAMQDGIVLLDADGTIQTCNASAERILGLSAEEMIGRTPLDPRWGAIREDGSPFPDEARPPVVTLRTGQPCSNVIMGVRKPSGALTWLSVNSQPLFQADGTTLAGVVASFEDISERKKIEERLQRTEAELATYKEQFQHRAESYPLPAS